ncbi:MAG: GldG family protein [Clostridiales bacterium]|jgi:ABC-2 type transport system permease protein|nr:GldG family protein [Clostridiales bacterium]
MMDEQNEKITNILKSKKARYGTFSLLLGVLAFIAFVAVNILAQNINKTVDLSSNKMFSISDATKTILSNLNENVTIYALFKTGQENPVYKEVLEQYAQNSSKIKLEYKDPSLYPAFANAYGSDGAVPEQNSIIIEGGSKFKVIPPDELVTYEMDYQTYQTYVSAVNIEPKVTNAIEFVLQNTTTVVYVLEGHNERGLNEEAAAALEDINFEVQNWNIFNQGVPDGESILYMTTPSQDYSADEASVISEYLKKGGRAVFSLGYMDFPHPNIESVLKEYGVNTQNIFIIEGDPNYQPSLNPTYLMPSYAEHEITSTLIQKNIPVYVFAPQGIEIFADESDTLSVAPLLTTTNKAYGKVDPASESISKEENDIDGPFTIASAVTASNSEGEQTFNTRICVITAEYLPFENSGGNFEFFTSMFNWVAERGAVSTYIAPKSLLTTETMNMSQLTSAIISAFSVIILPIAIFITGAVIVLRRNKK